MCAFVPHCQLHCVIDKRKRERERESERERARERDRDSERECVRKRMLYQFSGTREGG